MLNRFMQQFRRLDSRSLMVVGPSQVIIVEPAKTIVVGPSTGILVRPAEALLIQPPPRGVWQEKGWSRERGVVGATYRGYYMVIDRHTRQVQRFRGRIEVADHDIIPFVANPPAGLRAHPKGPCFSLVSQDWFRVHWHHPPNNVDDAILYVERVLDEVLNRRLL